MTARDKEQPGPEAEALKIEGTDWETAMKRAIEKQRPEEGWPERVVEKRKPGRKSGSPKKNRRRAK